jgi:metal-responsive CopG/Arc/MetJ family transcriptional regulator
MMTCYDDVVRTIIDLPDDQLRKLSDYCQREHVSRAEAIRRAVDKFTSDPAVNNAEREAAIWRTFGAWKHLGVTTDEYLAEIRSEWDRDEES